MTQTISGAAPARRPKRRSIKRAQAVWGRIFVTPTLLFFGVFTVLPLLMSIFLGFTDFDTISIELAQWTGFDNFVAAWNEPFFLKSIVNVGIYVLMSVPLTVICSLLVANLVSKKYAGSRLFRVLYYLPAVTSGVAIAFIWRWMFDDNYGVFNTLIEGLGLSKVLWFSANRWIAMFSIVVITTWSGIGGNMLIYLAALNGINTEIYEAADIDGANAWTKLWRITVPLIKPTTFFIVTMSIIGAFQLFDIVMFTTGGGPVGGTITPMMLIYDKIRAQNGGLASAMSLMLFAVIFIVSTLVQRILKEETY